MDAHTALSKKQTQRRFQTAEPMRTNLLRNVTGLFNAKYSRVCTADSSDKPGESKSLKKRSIFKRPPRKQKGAFQSLNSTSSSSTDEPPPEYSPSHSEMTSPRLPTPLSSTSHTDEADALEGEDTVVQEQDETTLSSGGKPYLGNDNVSGKDSRHDTGHRETQERFRHGKDPVSRYSDSSDGSVDWYEPTPTHASPLSSRDATPTYAQRLEQDQMTMFDADYAYASNSKTRSE